jgi:hypothetical protein
MHQDYVLRMIQQMTQVITRALGLRRDGEFDAALAEVSHAYGLLAGMPQSLVHGLSEDDLIRMLGVQGYLASDRCLAIAELLREEAEIHDDLGNEHEAIPRYRKSLRFYLETLDGTEDLRSADIPSLDEVIRALSGHVVSEGTRRLLLPYLEETGQFDQLENALMAWIDHGGGETARDTAIAAYRRLLERSDAELIVGGLTRGEIHEALAAIELPDPELTQADVDGTTR